jgi:hypothetical protein
LLGAGLRAGEYASHVIEDPSLIRDDIAKGLHNLRRQQDPFATPVADTFGGEFKRTFEVGMNNGELAFDIGSTFLGAGAMRGAARIGRISKAPTAQELAFYAENPGFAERLSLLYEGMGHHIVGRNARLPGWLGGGRYPRWLIESDLNKIDENMSTRDFYRNHVGVDKHYNGGKVGKAYGGTRWSAERDLGWTKYTPLDRLNYGTSHTTKTIAGPVLLGGTVTDAVNGEQAR